MLDIKPRCHLNASTVDAGFSINKRGGAQTVKMFATRDIKKG